MNKQHHFHRAPTTGTLKQYRMTKLGNKPTADEIIAHFRDYSFVTDRMHGRSTVLVLQSTQKHLRWLVGSGGWRRIERELHVSLSITPDYDLVARAKPISDDYAFYDVHVDVFGDGPNVPTEIVEINTASGIPRHRRIIPRDFFNEAKTLKCYGRLSCIIHDGFDRAKRTCPTSLTIDETNDAFLVVQDIEDGSLYVANYPVRYKGKAYPVRVDYNSDEPYPMYMKIGEDEVYVFTASGTLTRDFVRSLEAIEAD